MPRDGASKRREMYRCGPRWERSCVKMNPFAFSVVTSLVVFIGYREIEAYMFGCDCVCASGVNTREFRWVVHLLETGVGDAVTLG
jgi:hypothetical protein